MRLRQVGDLGQGGAVDAADARGEADVVAAVLLPVHTDVVAPAAGRVGGRRAIGQLPLQVLVLQHLAELLRAPVGDQELQAGAVAQPPVAVVAEDRDDALVDVGHVVDRHPGAEAHAQLRVGGQAAADPQVEARTVLGVLDADERHVVDLVHHVQHRRPGDRGLELAGEVRVRGVVQDPALHLLQGRRAVDDLVLGDTGDRGADHHAGRVAAGGDRGQADALQALPDLGHVLDADPVVLDVLPVGDVGRAARELLRDLTDDAQLRGGQRAAVDADAQHEVAVVQLLRLQDRRLSAVDALLALGVQTPPAHPSAQVAGVDGVETALGVDRLNTCPHIETVVVLLDLLVAVERSEVTGRPLTLAAVTAHLAAGGRGSGIRRRGGHG